MRLEDCLATLEQIHDYKALSEDSFTYLLERVNDMRLDKHERTSLTQKIHATTLSHQQFYHTFNALYQWANDELPDPKKYGKEAQRWLRREQWTYLGLWAMGTRLGAGPVALGFQAYLVSAPLLLLGGIGLGMAVTWRSDNKRLELAVSVESYIEDLAKYYVRGEHFSNYHLPNLPITIAHYTRDLHPLDKSLQKLHVYDGESHDFSKSCTQLGVLKNNITKIMKAIQKRKKYPLPKLTGRLAIHLIGADLLLTQEQNSEAIGFINESVTPLNNHEED